MWCETRYRRQCNWVRATPLDYRGGFSRFVPRVIVVSSRGCDGTQYSQKYKRKVLRTILYTIDDIYNDAGI